MRKILTTALIFIFFASPALGNEADLEGTSFSLMLGDTNVNLGGYTHDMVFTTYDGTLSEYPFFYDTQTGYITYSKELKKTDTDYKTDYYLIYDGYWSDDGEVHLNLGNIDHDSNGIDDVCEKHSTYNRAISGQWYSWDGYLGNISGTMTKNAGTQVGSYNLMLFNTSAGDVPISGKFYSGTVTGNIAYSKENNSITIDYYTTFEHSSSTYSITSTYEIIDQNKIQVNAVNNLFPTTIFYRNGNTYSADVTLSDGNDFTFWPDYQKWHLRIIDQNDSDKDGIPDFSDNIDNNKVNLTFLPLLLN